MNEMTLLDKIGTFVAHDRGNDSLPPFTLL